MTFPAQDLDCPDPEHCPVVRTLPRFCTVAMPKDVAWYRVYDATWGYDEHNPGYGDARLSPIDDPVDGARLPSMYLAAEHYPCTRALAVAVLRQPHGKRVVHGLVWHSRQAELTGQTPVEVVALYGKPRYTSARGSWQIFGAAHSPSTTGPAG